MSTLWRCCMSGMSTICPSTSGELTIEELHDEATSHACSARSPPTVMSDLQQGTSSAGAGAAKAALVVLCHVFARDLATTSSSRIA